MGYLGKAEYGGKGMEGFKVGEILEIVGGKQSENIRVEEIKCRAYSAQASTNNWAESCV